MLRLALAPLFALSVSLPLAAQTLPVETMPLTPATGLPPETYVGTVRASDMHGLSYAARGCIAAVSEEATRDKVAQAGQVLVELDDQSSLVTLRSAEARLSDLRAAVAERDLAISSAEADDRRRAEELAFVAKEFERNETMFRRGLINETTMEGVERRMMDATFAAERAKEAMATAESAKARAEIAVEIGELELQSAQIAHEDLTLVAPFDGVLVGFEATVGACVSEGGLAAQIYDPAQKAVDVYVLISRLTAAASSGMAIGAPVDITRVNGQTCGGEVVWIDTEADLESQYVKTTIEVAQSCAADLFLNEAVEVVAMGGTASDTYRIPANALLDSVVYLVSEDGTAVEPVPADVVLRDGAEIVVRLSGLSGQSGQSGAEGRHLVVDALAEGLDALLADPS